MRSVPVNTGHSYTVQIGAGLLSSLGGAVRGVHAPCRVCVVSDDQVAPLYGEKAASSLIDAGFDASVYPFPAGESSKTLATYARVQSHLIEMGLTRSDLLVALGGGVVGDLAGFCAATYQRGIPFVQVPTTLLCAVDASVGGKTAVDLPEGKNMVGAFHQPELVLCDTDTFSTLPPLRISDGAAEGLKHGLIADSALFDDMKGGAWTAQMDKIVEQNVLVKRSFVQADERDKGTRQLLNFGHTIGHAVEILSGFSLSHGQAVAIGMACEVRAARKMGLSTVGEAVVMDALEKNHLPAQCPFDAEQVLSVSLHDKKRAGNHMVVGVLEGIGSARLVSLSLPEFEAFVAMGVS